MTATDDDDISLSDSKEMKLLLQAIRELSPEKKRWLSKLCDPVIVPREPQQPEAEEPE